MKIISLKNTSILSLALCFAVSGCLKDKNYDDRIMQSVRPDGTQKIIELKLTANNSTKLLTRAYDNSDNDTTINLMPVNLASSEPAPEDIHVTLEPDTVLTKLWGDSLGIDYGFPPPDKFTIINAGLVVTIPKGSNVGYLQMKFKPSDFIGQTWSFEYKIKSIDKPGYMISGNLNNALAAVGTKNKYDGVYTVDGTLVDVVAPALSSVPGDPYPFTTSLVTTGPASVTMWNSGINYGHWIAGGSYYGFFSPKFTFDLTTNDMLSVVNDYGNPEPVRGRAGQMNGTGFKYNETTRSFSVSYIMTQGGSPRTTFTETYTYKGPR